MRRERTIDRPPPDWLDEFKTEPGRNRAVRPAPEPEPAPTEANLKVIEMPVEDDWFAHFSDDEPAPRERSLLRSARNETDQRMWPSVAPTLPPPTEMDRPLSTWDELQEFARTSKGAWPRGSRAAIALAALSVVAFGLVVALWFTGSDPGQTGVKHGSDTGQTPTSPPATPTPIPTPIASPVPSEAPPVAVARARPTPSPTPARSREPARTPTPAPTRAPAAPPPLTTGSASAAGQVLAAGAAGASSQTLPPAPTKPPPPGPAFTPAPSARVLGVPAATADTSSALSSPPPDATAAAKAAIGSLLEGYRNGHSTLNAGAVRDVWPGVNEPALARAFGQLDAQSMSFSSCGMEVNGQFAQAFCVGEVAFVPKVGSRTPRVEVRRWTFDLRRVNDRWVIDRVQTR